MEELPLAVAMTRPPAGMSIIVEKNRARLKSRDVHFVYVRFVRQNAKAKKEQMINDDT